MIHGFGQQKPPRVRTAYRLTPTPEIAMVKSANERKVAGIGDAAVERATGKTWSQWFSILDRAGAKKMAHRDIARHIHEAYAEVNGWWSQMITVGYEQARGMRDKHQKTDGFAVSRSRTMSAPVERAYAQWADARRRRTWLPDASLRMRTATENKSMRLTWLDNSTLVQVHFYGKGPAKCQVVVQHERLPDAKTAERFKTYWAERLDALQSRITK
jgi:hypothetical protein